MFQANSKRRLSLNASRRVRAQKRPIRPLRFCLEQLETRQMLSATPLQLVSSAGSGPANDASLLAAQQEQVSADGRYVAFTSIANNLVSGCAFPTISYFKGFSTTPSTRPVVNVYRFDRLTGHIDLVSEDASGTSAGNFDSSYPVISADGSVVAFLSDATNLGAASTGGQNVFARNFKTNTTSLVSMSSDGTSGGNGPSFSPAISADGNVVAFASWASNLSPLDTNGAKGDVFARNLSTGTTSLVSVNAAGTGSGDDASGAPPTSFIDPDGGPYLHSGFQPSISADGNKVAFNSAASTLVANLDRSPFLSNDFVRNISAGTTTVLSGYAGFGGIIEPGNAGGAGAPVISADGSVVAYVSADTGPINGLPTSGLPANIVVVNVATGARVQATSGNHDSVNPVLNADGSVVAFQSAATNFFQSSVPNTNSKGNVYVDNLKTHTLTMASVNASGTGGGDADSFHPVISADGTVVAFESLASDLAPLDTNRSVDQFGDLFGDDVFVRDVAAGATTLVSVNSAGAASGNGESSNAAISADGNTVVFNSTASNLVAGDSNGLSDIFQAHFVNSTIITIDGSGNLVATKSALDGNHAVNLKISYDSSTHQIVIQDLNGDPINSPVGTGSGTSAVSISPSSFAGEMIISGGIGNDSLSVAESFAVSGKNIEFDGAAGNNLLSVVGSGGTAIYSSVASGAGSVVIDGSSTVSFTGLTSADVSGLGAATVAAALSSGNVLVDAGHDTATGTTPAIVVSAETGAPVHLFNNANLVIAASGPAAMVVHSAIGQPSNVNGNANVTLKTDANGSVTFNADLLATGTVTIDTPQVTLNTPINTASKSTTAATTFIGVGPSGNLQNGIDLARAGVDVSVPFGGNFSGPLHSNKTIVLFFATGTVINLPLGTTNADTQNTLSLLQNYTAGGVPELVLPTTGANLTTAINTAPVVNPSKAFVQLVLLVSGTASKYDIGSKLLTVSFVNGPTLSQQPDDLNPAQRKLVVTGTAGNDEISFTQKDDEVKVEFTGFPNGTFQPTGRIVANGLAGDDNISVGGGVGQSAWLYGGDGNDTLKGGGGNDILQGGAGNDTLTAGGGRDLLIGGAGSDQIDGKGGQDILISGTTQSDNNDQALLAILNEWSSDRTYAQRVANIMGTGSGATFDARLNGPYFLNSSTVSDDNAIDTLLGGGGTDFYFANLVREPGDGATQLDQITGQTKKELAFDIDFVDND
jgi:hypothetical protein